MSILLRLALALALSAGPLAAREVISAIALRASAGAARLTLDVQLSGPEVIAANATGTYYLGAGGGGGLTAAFSDEQYAGQILPRNWMGWGVLDLVDGRPRLITLGSYGWSLDQNHYPLEWLNWDMDMPPCSGLLYQDVWGWIPDYNINVGYSAVWSLDRMTVRTRNVPEPAVWLMMVLGFGATGTAMRRRASDPAIVQAMH